MGLRLRRALVAGIPVLVGACLLGALALLVIAAPTTDRNRDGRPDIWRSYDPRGQVAEVAIDSNFDGRSDIREYYRGGALVRRETDRDFNDRVDLVQEFDPKTRELVRAVTDLDFDGVADLLELFHGGRTVY